MLLGTWKRFLRAILGAWNTRNRRWTIMKKYPQIRICLYRILKTLRINWVPCRASFVVKIMIRVSGYSRIRCLSPMKRPRSRSSGQFLSSWRQNSRAMVLSLQMELKRKKEGRAAITNTGKTYWIISWVHLWAWHLINWPTTFSYRSTKNSNGLWKLSPSSRDKASVNWLSWTTSLEQPPSKQPLTAASPSSVAKTTRGSWKNSKPRKLKLKSSSSNKCHSSCIGPKLRFRDLCILLPYTNISAIKLFTIKAKKLKWSISLKKVNSRSPGSKRIKLWKSKIPIK